MLMAFCVTHLSAPERLRCSRRAVLRSGETNGELLARYVLHVGVEGHRHGSGDFKIGLELLRTPLLIMSGEYARLHQQHGDEHHEQEE